MDKIICWCCGQPSGQHKLSCGIRSRVEALQDFIDNMHNVPEDVLDYISHKIYVESLERRFNFDEENENED